MPLRTHRASSLCPASSNQSRSLEDQRVGKGCHDPRLLSQKGLQELDCPSCRCASVTILQTNPTEIIDGKSANIFRSIIRFVRCCASTLQRERVPVPRMKLTTKFVCTFGLLSTSPSRHLQDTSKVKSSDTNQRKKVPARASPVWSPRTCLQADRVARVNVDKTHGARQARVVISCRKQGPQLGQRCCILV